MQLEGDQAEEDTYRAVIGSRCGIRNIFVRAIREELSWRSFRGTFMDCPVNTEVFRGRYTLAEMKDTYHKQAA